MDKREQYAKKVLEAMGAVIYNDHFVYTSGRHGSAYIDKTAIYTNPVATRYLCRFLVQQIPQTVQQEIEVVVGSALAGIALAHTVVLCLSECRPEAEPRIGFAFVEENERREKVLRPRFQQEVHGRRCLIVDDVLNTGHTVRGMIDVIGKEGGQPTAVAALYDRQDWDAERFDNLPVYSVIRMKLQESYEGEDCPICRMGRPINQCFGRGRDFMERKEGG